MNFFLIILFAFFIISQYSCQPISQAEKSSRENIPEFIKGNFIDDYGIQFTINDSVWTQHPNVKYHIISWDTAAQYLLARNDESNPGDTGLFTRIDYMKLLNMDPFRWGFCLTVYKAKTIEEARSAASADRLNPKKGCNGYPFSRMKPVESIQNNNLKNY